MSQTNTLKFGVIGAGKIGTFHTRTLSTLPGVTLVGVCDPDLMRAQKLAWQYNATPYSKMEELVGQVDAVIVAAPTPLHHQIGVYCLEHGVHTLVEKPIASTLDQARDLIQTAKMHDRILQVGHVERFNPAVVAAMKYIQNPQFITMNRMGPYDPRMSHIGVVLDLMIHDIDLLLTLVPSEVVSIDATGLSVFTPYEDIANVRIHFANGAVADLTASRASFERARFMHLFQQNSYISVDFMNARVKLYKKEKPTISSMEDVTVEYPPVQQQLPITAEILHFIDCIKTHKTPAPSGEKGSKALELALKIIEKMHRFNVSSQQPAVQPLQEDKIRLEQSLKESKKEH